jgi:hypothetical protein
MSTVLRHSTGEKSVGTGIGYIATLFSDIQEEEGE